jgi:hypothetical protein
MPTKKPHRYRSGYEALLAIRDAQRLLRSLDNNGEAGAVYRQFLEDQHNHLVKKHGLTMTNGGQDGAAALLTE